MNEEAKQQNAHARSQKRIKTATYVILAFAAIIAGYIYTQSIPPPAGKYDAFAKCIAQTGTKFYGAFWCPHCHNQKNEFGSAAQFLPYVECSPGEGQPQYKVCTDAGVEGYPTWVFPDGSRLSGEVSLETLSQKTGCPLTGSASSTTTGTTSTNATIGSSSPAQ